ncbi:MAG: toll/interleukin-1 receptor domain-containing protein [Actinobacteria bacterium]|nr:toll/interleukin-1 receptor domain-containing protein [Actinomycetota bacterium]
MASYFISYTGVDESWATWIAAELEEAGHQTIVQAWDFRPGMNFVLAMSEALKADYTIAVLSPAYVAATFTGPEWAAAFAADPSGRTRKLIPVRVESLDLSGLLKDIVYIDLLDKHEKQAREALMSGITEGRAKPRNVPFPGKTHPVFPGSASAAASATEAAVPFTEMVELAKALVAEPTRGSGHALLVGLAPSRIAPLLRPSEFDAERVVDELMEVALFRSRILDRAAGAPASRSSGVIEVRQQAAYLVVHDSGRMLVAQPATDRGQLAVIEEDLHARIEKALDFFSQALQILDPTHLVVSVALAGRVEGAEYVGWLTQAERAANPTSITMPGFGRKPEAVHLGRSYALDELTSARSEIAADFVALLRREVKG